jgi:hypothetical protein
MIKQMPIIWKPISAERYPFIRLGQLIMLGDKIYRVLDKTNEPRPAVRVRIGL